MKIIGFSSLAKTFFRRDFALFRAKLPTYKYDKKPGKPGFLI
jgi:hypothetical protein